jgi:hypothetical protein
MRAALPDASLFPDIENVCHGHIPTCFAVLATATAASSCGPQSQESLQPLQHGPRLERFCAALYRQAAVSGRLLLPLATPSAIGRVFGALHALTKRIDGGITGLSLDGDSCADNSAVATDVTIGFYKEVFALQAASFSASKRQSPSVLPLARCTEVAARVALAAAATADAASPAPRPLTPVTLTPVTPNAHFARHPQSPLPVHISLPSSHSPPAFLQGSPPLALPTGLFSQEWDISSQASPFALPTRSAFARRPLPATGPDSFATALPLDHEAAVDAAVAAFSQSEAARLARTRRGRLSRTAAASALRDALASLAQAARDTPLPGRKRSRLQLTETQIATIGAAIGLVGSDLRTVLDALAEQGDLLRQPGRKFQIT